MVWGPHGFNEPTCLEQDDKACCRLCSVSISQTCRHWNNDKIEQDKSQNVKADEIGPIQIIKRVIDLASHL